MRNCGLPLPVADKGRTEFVQPRRWRKRSEAETANAARWTSTARHYKGTETYTVGAAIGCPQTRTAMRSADG